MANVILWSEWIGATSSREYRSVCAETRRAIHESPLRRDGIGKQELRNLIKLKTFLLGKFFEGEREGELFYKKVPPQNPNKNLSLCHFFLFYFMVDDVAGGELSLDIVK